MKILDKPNDELLNQLEQENDELREENLTLKYYLEELISVFKRTPITKQNVFPHLPSVQDLLERNSTR